MAVEVRWDDEQHTVLRVVLQDWGWDDLANGATIAARERMLDEAARPVSMLVIMRDTPRNLLGMLPQMAQSPGFTHPKVKQVIVVADTSIVKMATEIFKRVYGPESRRMRVAASISEAYQMIADAQTDKALPDD